MVHLWCYAVSTRSPAVSSCTLVLRVPSCEQGKRMRGLVGAVPWCNVPNYKCWSDASLAEGEGGGWRWGCAAPPHLNFMTFNAPLYNCVITFSIEARAPCGPGRGAQSSGQASGDDKQVTKSFPRHPCLTTTPTLAQHRLLPPVRYTPSEAASHKLSPS